MSSINSVRGYTITKIRLDLANNKMYVDEKLYELNDPSIVSVLVPLLGLKDTNVEMVTRCTDQSNEFSRRFQQVIDEFNLSLP